jgi:hypothetical protein
LPEVVETAFAHVRGWARRVSRSFRCSRRSSTSPRGSCGAADEAGPTPTADHPRVQTVPSVRLHRTITGIGGDETPPPPKNLGSEHLNRRPCRGGRPPVSAGRLDEGRPTRPDHTGPNFQWTAKVAGKTGNRRLAPDEAAFYSQWIRNDRQVRALLAEIRELAA